MSTTYLVACVIGGAPAGGPHLRRPDVDPRCANCPHRRECIDNAAELKVKEEKYMKGARGW